MRGKLKTLFSIVFVILLFVFFHYLGWLKAGENFFRNLITPASRFMYGISIKLGEQNQEFKSLEDLQTAYLEASQALRDNQADRAKLQILEAENAQLRELLNFPPSDSYRRVGAEVIGKNIDSFGQTIILNRGEPDEIKAGQAVITGRGALVGKVIKVEKNVSLARLLNDNQSKVAATVLNQEKSLGLVEGGYGISIRLNFIPQNEVVKVGDMIVTSGLEADIPKGLLIGTVAAVEKEAYQPFQKAILSPIHDLDKLSLVAIIIKQ